MVEFNFFISIFFYKRKCRFRSRSAQLSKTRTTHVDLLQAENVERRNLYYSCFLYHQKGHCATPPASRMKSRIGEANFHLHLPSQCTGYSAAYAGQKLCDLPR